MQNQILFVQIICFVLIVLATRTNGQPGSELKSEPGKDVLWGPKGEPGAKGDTGPAGKRGKIGMPGFPGTCSADKCRERSCTGKFCKSNGVESRRRKKINKSRTIGNALTHEHSYLLVHHSQTTFNATCPDGSTKLWDGFSLVQMENYTKLGSTGSGACLREFNTSPIKMCDRDQRCARPGPDSQWLANVLQNATEKKIDQISRCAVCSAPALIITLHSQSNNIPVCPDKWTRIWSGYSFAMGGVQSLNDPSSCLEHFTEWPFTVCAYESDCYKFRHNCAFWLTTGKKPYDDGPDVSRCSVCMQE